jgi:HK97 family phage major capsid protein
VASEVAKRLHEQVQRTWHEIEQITLKASDEHRNFNSDEQARYDALHLELDGNDKRLKEVLADEKRAKESDDAFNAMAGRPEVSGARQATGIEAEIRKFFSPNPQRDDKGRIGLEIPNTNSRLMHRLGGGRPITPTEVRVLTDGYVSPGTFTNQTNAGIVPIDFYDQLLSYLIEVSGVMQTGPSVLNTTGGEPIQMPIVQSHTGLSTASPQVMNAVTAAQGGTLANGTGIDPIFGQKTLSSNKFGMMIQVARELIDDSGVNLLGYLAMSAGRDLGNYLGSQLINGGVLSGSLLAGAPVSVTGATPANITAGPATATNQVVGGPSYNNLLDMEYSVIAPYRQSRSCYWLAADKTLASLRKLTDTVGRPIWEPSIVLGAPDLLLGKPIVADPFMPAVASGNSSILFGDFSQFYVRMVGGVRFERSDDFAFSTDLVSFRAIIRADANLLNPPAYAPQPIVAFHGG